MKATYKFNLPKERTKHRIFLNADNFHSALYDFGEQLRQWDKYDDLENGNIDIELVRNVFMRF